MSGRAGADHGQEDRAGRLRVDAAAKYRPQARGQPSASPPRPCDGDEPDAPVPAPGQRSALGSRCGRAIDGEHGEEPAEEPTLEGLRSAFRAVTMLLLDGRLAETGTVLPALLRDADALDRLGPCAARERGTHAALSDTPGRGVPDAATCGSSLRPSGRSISALEDASDPLHRGVGDGRTLLGTDPAGPSRRDDGAGIPVG